MSIAELIKIVEGLTGPDREVDALITCALDDRPEWLKTDKRALVVTSATGYVAAGRNGPGFPAKNYTASIDAAIALAERAIPGVELELTNLYNVARATLHHETGQFYGASESNSLPVAICLAVLSALPSGEQP